jgi:ribosome maturation factor RimP
MPQIDLESLRGIVEPSIRFVGVELVELQWAGGTLRITIDRAGGVNLDDCEKVSTGVSAALDAYDPIAGRYMLEVSSPGAERPLRSPADWTAALGKHVLVRFRTGESETSVQGLLSEVADDHVTVTTMRKTRATEHEIELGDVVSARIAVVI